jgi:hypothetical protein
MSFDPPGLVGITNSTFRSGFQPCAGAASASTTPPTAMTAIAAQPLNLFRMSPPAYRSTT